jgi:hypothetical protein
MVEAAWFADARRRMKRRAETTCRVTVRRLNLGTGCRHLACGHVGLALGRELAVTSERLLAKAFPRHASGVECWAGRAIAETEFGLVSTN